MAKAGRNDDSIPFWQWQRHDVAAEAYFRTKARGDGRGHSARGGDSNQAVVKNNSGAARSAGEILEFTGWALDDPGSQDLPANWLTGGSPTLVNGFGVLLREVADGEYESCQVSGVCRAAIDVTDADHRYAVVAASDYNLQSAAIGPVKILYKPSGTGSAVMCLVNLIGMVGEVLVKNATGSDIAVNSSGTFSIFSGTPGSETDTGQTISAYNKSSVAFKNGKFGSVSILEGRAYAVPWQT